MNKYAIGDNAWAIRAVEGGNWALYNIEITNYWIEGYNCYSGKFFENGNYEVKVFSAPLIFSTRSQAEVVLKYLRLQSSIIKTAQNEINKIIYG